MNKPYEDLIKEIRSIKPVVKNPNELIDRIMQDLPERKKTYFFISWRAKPSHWLAFSTLRIVSNMAALILIGYFIYQQWQINTKIDRLEGNIVMNGMTDDFKVKSQYEKAFDMLQAKDATLVMDSVRNDVIHINRKSFNFLLFRMQQLEKENETYREKYHQLQDREFINQNHEL